MPITDLTGTKWELPIMVLSNSAKLITIPSCFPFPDATAEDAFDVVDVVNVVDNVFFARYVRFYDDTIEEWTYINEE